MNDKRIEQLREAWIKNVMNKQFYSREESEALYEKIQPYVNDQKPCKFCGKIKADHYNGQMGYNRCIDDAGIFYGTITFKA